MLLSLHSGIEIIICHCIWSFSVCFFVLWFCIFYSIVVLFSVNSAAGHFQYTMISRDHTGKIKVKFKEYLKNDSDTDITLQTEFTTKSQQGPPELRNSLILTFFHFPALYSYN